VTDATALLRLYAAYRCRQLAAADGPATQAATLLALVRRARDTRFGRDHGFAAIRSVADFQARVPLRRYEDMWQAYWQPSFPSLRDCTWPGLIPYFATTSGTTTGRTKYIPCSQAMIASNRRAAADLMAYHVSHRPQSRVLGGLSFMLGGSKALTPEAPSVASGDLSGIMVAEMPWWARRRYFPRRELALIGDWEEKIERLAPESLAQDIRSLAGTPSWLLIFCDKLRARRPESDGRLVNLYPNLELLVHGGVNFAPYRHRFATLLDGSHAELREVYPASEGFFAIADRGPGEGLRLLLDTGLFYEFVPVDELDSPAPTRHWIGTAEPGVNYAIAVSTCAGAWGYIVGDTLTLTERCPPRVLVTGRTSYSLSAFGEHLIGAEIEEAVRRAAEAIACDVSDFSVGPLFPQSADELGRHLFVVEFAAEVPPAAQQLAFVRALDRALAEANDDYRVHRAEGYGLHEPALRAVPPGFFAAWMKARGQLGGQHKVPRVVLDATLLDSLRAFDVHSHQ